MSKDQEFPCIEQDRTVPFDIVIQRTGSLTITDKCGHCQRVIARSLSERLNRTAQLDSPIEIKFECMCGAKPWSLIVRLALRASVDRS